MGYFESFLAPIVSQVTDLINQGVVQKTYIEFAFDLNELYFKHNYKVRNE